MSSASEPQNEAMSHRRPLRLLASLVLTLALGASAGAQLLPVVDPGFELLSRPLAVGEITNGAGGTGVQVGTRASFHDVPQFVNLVEVPGWRTYLPTGPTTFHGGVLNPPVDFLKRPFVSGYSGANVAAVRHYWMQQTVAVAVRPSTRYRLSFLAGGGLWGPSEAAYVALLASPDLATLAFPGVPGVITLAQWGLLLPPGSEGLMLPWEVEFETPPVLPGDLGSRYLAIAFVGGDGISMTCYDDVRLRAVALGPRERVQPSDDPGGPVRER